MHDPEDIRWTKALRREFTKRQIDVTLAELRVHHGTAYIRGTIKPMRGGPQDTEHEVNHIAHILRHQGVREVVIDCKFRS
jgi:hypothetical protein